MSVNAVCSKTILVKREVLPVLVGTVKVGALWVEARIGSRHDRVTNCYCEVALMDGAIGRRLLVASLFGLRANTAPLHL